MQHKTLWRATLLGLCGLVFFFALHAKTAVYNDGAPAKVTPSTASKLWINGQKIKSQSFEPAGSVLFWIAFTCFFGLYLHKEQKVQPAFRIPPTKVLTLRHLQRFLRPPPVLG
jgi:hypothetical protein